MSKRNDMCQRLKINAERRCFNYQAKDSTFLGTLVLA